MTKKTNSWLFRLGVSSLWKNKSPNFYKFINDVRLEKIIHHELKKRKFNVLSISWHSKNTQVWVYDSLYTSSIFKQEVFQYYKQTKNALKLVELYSLHKKLILGVLADKRFYVQKSLRNNKVSFDTLVHCLIKYYELQHILKIFKMLKIFQWAQLKFVLKSFSLLTIIYKHSLTRLLPKSLNLNTALKLKKIWSICFFKVLSIFLENLIFYTKNRFVSIEVTSIWHRKGVIFRYFFRDSFMYQLLTLASIYNNSCLLSEFISFQLQKDKNHRRSLRRIVLSIEKFWVSYNFGFNGFQLRVTGKLNGRMRKSKYQYIIGKVSSQTLQTMISYSMTVTYTKFGLLSNKLWLFYGNKRI